MTEIAKKTFKRKKKDPDVGSKKHTIESVEDLKVFVKTRRKDLNLTQEDLAALSGVTKTWISEFENGYERRKGLTFSTFQKVAKALDVRMVFIPNTDE